MFSERLRLLRHDRGMTLQQLADKLGVTRGSVSKWETGLNQPDLHRIADIAQALSADPLFLLGLESRFSNYCFPVLYIQEVKQLERSGPELLADWQSFPTHTKASVGSFFVRLDNDFDRA